VPRSNEDAKELLNSSKPAFQHLFTALSEYLDNHKKAAERYQELIMTRSKIESNLAHINQLSERIGESMKAELGEGLSPESSLGEPPVDDENSNLDEPLK
jgi:hypothetical protein